MPKVGFAGSKALIAEFRNYCKSESKLGELGCFGAESGFR